MKFSPVRCGKCRPNVPTYATSSTFWKGKRRANERLTVVIRGITFEFLSCEIPPATQRQKAEAVLNGVKFVRLLSEMSLSGAPQLLAPSTSSFGAIVCVAYW